MKLGIFFAGSGQRAESQKFVYHNWAEKLDSVGYETKVFDGVGQARNTGEITGYGWAKIILQAMLWIEEKANGGGLERVVVVGQSRGGVQAVICAHCLKTAFPDTPVFVFAIDPVQGAHYMNDGSFDMRSRRWGMKGGSRDNLKARYELSDEAPKTVPNNVRMYLSVLAQFRGGDRNFGTWGFTPQSPTLGNMRCHAAQYKVYELPGDHSTGVYTGLNDDGSAHARFASRHARGIVTLDMFGVWLQKTDFGKIAYDDNFTVFDNYCLIANEDLGGVQIDGRNSGFSFLRASKSQGGFTATADSRMLRGRGHLVASSQPRKGRGPYVNERHRELGVKIELQAQTDHNLFNRYPNMGRWMHSDEYDEYVSAPRSHR